MHVIYLHSLPWVALDLLSVSAKEQLTLLRGTPDGWETKQEPRRLRAQHVMAARRMWYTNRDAVLLPFDADGISAASSYGPSRLRYVSIASEAGSSGSVTAGSEDFST